MAPPCKRKRKREPPDKPPPPVPLTVKCGLASFCTNARLKSTISQAVRDASQITWELSKILNLHFVHACENGLRMLPLIRKGKTDFYPISKGVSCLAGGSLTHKLLDLSHHRYPEVAAVAPAQQLYMQQRPASLRWAPRNGISQILKSCSQVYWDNCSQAYMANFDRQLLRWWEGKVYRKANSRGNSLKARRRLAHQLIRACKRGSLRFGLPEGVHLSNEDVAALVALLVKCRDHVASDHVNSAGLPHPCPQPPPGTPRHVWMSSIHFEWTWEEQLQKHWIAYVRWSWRMLKNVHKHRPPTGTVPNAMLPVGHRRPSSKAWTLLPHKRLSKCYIHIDSEALADLLHAQSKRDVLRNSREAWQEYFDISRVTTEQHKFLNAQGNSGSIKTDGVGCSVLLMRPGFPPADPRARMVGSKAKQQYVTQPPPAGSRVVAIDPGKKDPLIGVVEGDCPQHRREVFMSGVQYREDAGFRWFHQRYLKRLQRGGNVRALMTGVPAARVASVHLLSQHLAYVLEHAERLRGFMGRTVVMKDRWGAHVAKQRVISQLCKMVTGGEEAVTVAFGAARSGHVHKLPSGPVKLVHAALKRHPRVTVWDVDEYLTSQICSRCGTRALRKVHKRDQRRDLHFVLRCSNPLCRVLWQRDVNAARNILAIFRGCCGPGGRPAMFCRAHDDPYGSDGDDVLVEDLDAAEPVDSDVDLD